MTTRALAAQRPSTVSVTGTRLGVHLVLSGQLDQQVGAAVASGLFGRIGVTGVVGLRLGVAAIVLLALCRPSLRAVRRSNWLVVVAYGGALAGMNVLFYEAISGVPLGAAVTLEILGPLALSVLASRRLLSLLWAAQTVRARRGRRRRPAVIAAALRFGGRQPAAAAQQHLRRADELRARCRHHRRHPA